MDTIPVELYRDNIFIGDNLVPIDTSLIDIVTEIVTFFDSTIGHIDSFICSFSSHKCEPISSIDDSIVITPSISPSMEVFVPGDLHVDDYRKFTLTSVIELANKTHYYDGYIKLVPQNKIRVDITKPMVGLINQM